MDDLQRPPGPLPADDADTAAMGRAARAMRVGSWTLAAGIVAAVAWSALAPLDEGVPAPGTVVVDTKRKPVQHLSGGIIRSVLVREGDVVAQGQPLLRLDDAVARANHEAVRQRYLGLRALEGRLLAERDGLASIVVHPDLRAASADPRIQLQIVAQEQLLATRRAALRADLQAIEESIQAQKASLEAYRGMAASRGSQLALLKEELASTRGLVEEGYAPRNRQLELERMVAEVQSAVTDLQGNALRAQRTIGELAQRALGRRGEAAREVGGQLTEVLREVQADAEKLKAAAEELERTEIRSPAAGQVMGLAAQTVGAVVQPAQRLMEVAPEGEALVLEARVAPHLIDRIHGGLPVDVRFSTFAHSPQLVVDGRVTTVSADLLTDPQTNASYYLARVTVTPEGLRTLGKRELQPGMPCEVVFRTGERSLLTYLLHPLTRRVAAAMKEE